jgi:hypothetical protein
MASITHPGRTIDEIDRIERAKMRAEMEHLQKRVERLSTDMAAIFDGIDRGEQVDLQYPSGEVVTITRARPRKTQEG